MYLSTHGPRRPLYQFLKETVHQSTHQIGSHMLLMPDITYSGNKWCTLSFALTKERSNGTFMEWTTSEHPSLKRHTVKARFLFDRTFNGRFGEGFMIYETRLRF